MNIINSGYSKKQINFSHPKEQGFGASVQGGERLGSKILDGIDRFQKKIEKGGFFAEFFAVDGSSYSSGLSQK